MIEGTLDIKAEDTKDGWVWVVRGCEAHEVQGGGRVGWRVLDESEIVKGEEGSGALQGL
jgi:hypothetical protein